MSRRLRSLSDGEVAQFWRRGGLRPGADAGRAEGANVGVVLVCPALGDVRVVMALEALERFGRREGNALVLSPPGTVAVDDPAGVSDRLHEELVLVRER